VCLPVLTTSHISILPFSAVGCVASQPYPQPFSAVCSLPFCSLYVLPAVIKGSYNIFHVKRGGVFSRLLPCLFPHACPPTSYSLAHIEISSVRPQLVYMAGVYQKQGCKHTEAQYHHKYRMCTRRVDLSADFSAYVVGDIIMTHAGLDSTDVFKAMHADDARELLGPSLSSHTYCRGHLVVKQRQARPTVLAVTHFPGLPLDSTICNTTYLYTALCSLVAASPCLVASTSAHAHSHFLYAFSTHALPCVSHIPRQLLHWRPRPHADRDRSRLPQVARRVREGWYMFSLFTLTSLPNYVLLPSYRSPRTTHTCHCSVVIRLPCYQ
jgi:hypothetical protein